MTTLDYYQSRTRDIQDGFERMVWGEQTFIDGAGSVIKARGTGTIDEEAVVINTGMGMHVPKDTNTEVFLISNGSDTNQKHAILSIPRNKQRKWAEGTNGLQYWDDPARAIEMNSKRAYVDDANFATRDGLFEVKDGKIYLRADVMIQGNVGCTGTFQSPNIPQTPPPVAGTAVVVPGFEA